MVSSRSTLGVRVSESQGGRFIVGLKSKFDVASKKPLIQRIAVKTGIACGNRAGQIASKSPLSGELW